MSEHTKGPWFPYIHRGKTLTLAIFDSSKSQSDPIVNWLGFDSCSKPDKEKIANAKLIASAPDMHDEITRLLAVEAAAKILAGPSNVRYSPESQDMAAYQCLTCHSSWDKKSDPVHASSCPVLVINPIGDTK